MSDPIEPGASPVADPGEATPNSNHLLEQMLTSEVTVLPEDSSSAAFLDAIQSMKGLFQTRPEYNAMVCDELAKRGHAPNAKLVLNVGRWGNPAAIGQDVQQWYASLAKRLSLEHARIPTAARLSANGLFEQLWVLALQSAAEPALKRAEGLQAQLDEVLESTRETIAEDERVIGLLKADLERVGAQLKTAEDRIVQSEARQITLGHEIDTLQRSIAQAAVDRKESE
jgi:hypothetical protein